MLLNKKVITITAKIFPLFFLATTALASPVSQPIEKIEITSRVDWLLEQNRSKSEPYYFEFQGKNYIGLPGVFSPIVFPSSNATKTIPVRQGETFLEIGSGTGIFSIQAALAGASKVLAVDINPSAVENTRINVESYGLSDRVESRLSDLFAAIRPDEKFDTVFWSIPFCHRPNPEGSMDYLELSVFDPEHGFLQRYLAEARDHLNPGGRILLTYSRTHGDHRFLNYYAEVYGWSVTQIKSDENDFISVELYELKEKKNLEQ